MSFGRPPGLSNILVAPPERGSFPLDHEGKRGRLPSLYLKCLREHKNSNSQCRSLSKDYLECRMSRGLMERDDWKNLGLADVDSSRASAPTATSSSTSPPSTNRT
ncbi:hypothetical protein BS47DRAFT_1298345 [Hydnum rufescens UP504]|uniref:CHCH domain-containing protein n=1 Tax=Hydnum rufescens UP504 TaxID=1448309 RepID=A0A9P6DVS2_9AGAM|nr:hypothetical protein BS47DRAFT_1298345 [Hydnum rufescens UP504]